MSKWYVEYLKFFFPKFNKHPIQMEIIILSSSNIYYEQQN
jgi:hypothetical protein